jgi:hypothetical protein
LDLGKLISKKSNMKNIHLLPTEKPSRLMIDTIENKLYLQPILHEKTINVLPQNIYITDSEEIKEGDWYLDTFNTQRIKANEFSDHKHYGNSCKKIILTTDPNLIADGVQAIDDEFLEWFVKNPSCEYVEVNDSKVVKEHIFDGSNDGEIVWEKKIIIPQEEPKRKIDTCYNFDMEIGCVQDICRCEQEEPKQETLTYTEAAKKEERIFNSTMISKQETLEEAAANLADPNLCKTDNWIAGANYQAERMYSEEEVYDILFKHTEYFLGGGERMSLTQWFEQFKKK